MSEPAPAADVDEGPLKEGFWIEAGVASAVIFLIAPLLLASTNEPHPLRLPVGVWLGLAVLAGMSFVLLVLIQYGATAMGVGSGSAQVTRFVCYFVVLSCFAFPLVTHSGQLELGEIQANVVNIIVCFALAGGLLWASRGQLRLVRLGVLAYVIGNLVLVGYVFASDPSSTLRSLPISSTYNIFVISFDGLSGSAVEAVLRENAELAAEFSGFVIFDSVASSSPATEASTAAELYGNQNFKEFADTIEEVWESSPDELTTNLLIESGYAVTTYGFYGSAMNERGIRIRPPAAPTSSSVEILNLSLARTLSPVAFLPDSLSTNAERLLTAVGGEDSELDALKAEMLNSFPADNAKRLTLSYLDYAAMLQGLHLGDELPAAFFFHFTHTHYPVEWDRDCTFRGDEAEWFAYNQDYAGVLLETECALRQYADFIDQLRQFDALDRSLVILKSDHGKPVGYAPEGEIESLMINDHPTWGMSRYAPFLAYRTGEATSKSVTFKSSPVMIDDLARTICEEASIEFDCEGVPGYNVIRDEIDPRSIVSAFVVESKDSDYRYDSHQSITFERGSDVFMSLYHALVDAGMVYPLPAEGN